METIKNSNSSIENGRTMTLKGYYRNLPDASTIHPKTDLLVEIQKKAGVSFTTARNWVVYGMKPNRPEHVDLLSEITGIPVENLWTD